MTVPVVCANYRRISRGFPAGLGAASVALLLSAAAAPADAQITVEPKAGVAVAGGALGDYLNPGPSASVRIGYALRPGTSFFAEGAYDQFGDRELIEATVTGPEMDAIRFVVGVEQELLSDDLPPAYEPWSLRVRLGGGAMRLESDRFRHIGGGEDFVFSTTAPMAAAGVAVGYTIRGLVTLFVDGGLNWAYVNEDKTLDIARLAPGYVDSFESIFSFPYNVGVRLPF